MLACHSETASGDQVDLEPDRTGDGFDFNTIFIGDNFTLELWIASEESFAGEHPLMRIENGVATYYLQDAMGSVVGMAGSSGVSTGSIKYDGFGNVTSSVGSAASISPTVGFDFRLHGMALDQASGLYFVRARTYDSKTGRFLTRDPFAGVLSRPETLNPYVLDHSNPHVWRDPSGRITLIETMVVVGIIGVIGSLGLPSLSNHLKNVRAYKYGWEARAAGIATNYGAAFADTITLQLGRVLRDLAGIQGVDTNSPEYYAGMATGVAAMYWAGFFTAGAGSSGLAVSVEEVAPQAVDHIVLGISGQGLEQTAAQVGGRTLMRLGEEAWKQEFLASVANPATRITISLRGLAGENAEQAVNYALNQFWRYGIKAGNTNWEIAQIYQMGRIGTVRFVDALGRAVENPFF